MGKHADIMDRNSCTSAWALVDIAKAFVVRWKRAEHQFAETCKAVSIQEHRRSVSNGIGLDAIQTRSQADSGVEMLFGRRSTARRP